MSRTADAVRFWLGSGNDNLFVTCLRNVVSLLDRLDSHRAVVELVATTTTQTPDRPSYGVEAEPWTRPWPGPETCWHLRTSTPPGATAPPATSTPRHAVVALLSTQPAAHGQSRVG